MTITPPVRSASWRWCVAALATFALCLLPVTARGAEPQSQATLIVQVAPGADMRAVSAAVNATGAEVLREIRLINGLAVDASPAEADSIRALAGVEAVSPNAGVVKTGFVDPSALASAYNQSLRTDKAWSLGFTGRGIGVAVLDTGIQGDLADFRTSQSDATSRVTANAVVNPAADNPYDTFGHGTHIAGLVAGNGTNRAAGDAQFGRYAGTAPDANLIAVKIDDGHGGATVLDVIDGLQFVVDHKAHLGIRIVNLSLSSTVAESHLTDPLDAAVESAWLNGLVVVVAAGNRGAEADAVNYAPANDPWVITIGAVDDQGTRDITDDKLTPWSSRGTTQDGHIKPDVLAPGAHLVSTIPAGSDYTSLCPACNVDGGYFRVGGTSMAAGVASGAIATILQAHPTWTPDQVKGALLRRTRAVENQSTSDGVVVDAHGVPLPIGTTVTSEVVGAEIAVDKVLSAYVDKMPPPANAGLRVNGLVDPATGAIDYTRTSWTRTSWTDAVDTLRTSWTRTSWTRTSWTRTSWTATEGNCVDLERTSWTRTSWTAEELDSAKVACANLLATVDPTRTSWTRTSWTRTSWTSSFDK